MPKEEEFEKLIKGSTTSNNFVKVGFDNAKPVGFIVGA